MLASSILLVAVAVAGQAEKKWEVVTSREGNFTVEMPAKPNHSKTSTMTGPNGDRTTINEIGLENREGGFFMFWLETLVDIPKNLEDRYFDFIRDLAAEKFHGKVISDKKVQVDFSRGRDFAIRAQDPKLGNVNIRARAYLQGKQVYLLLVVSQPNKDFPADTARFLGSFAFGIHPGGTTVKADARETEAVGKELAGWGMVIDPDGDVQIKPSSRSLLVEIPGTLHDLVADIGKFNSPRIVRSVEGDFVSIVRIDGTFTPGGKSTKARTLPLNAGGLLLWKDSDNYIFLNRMATLVGDNKINSIIAFEEREAGHRGAMHNLGGLPNAPVFLRLERKGGRITGAFSGDGVNWEPLKPMDTSWTNGPVKVGLVAINTSTEPTTIKYENYSLKKK